MGYMYFSLFCQRKKYCFQDSYNLARTLYPYDSKQLETETVNI